MTTARGFALTTAVRVIDGVHGHTAIGGANALPTIASRLADSYVFVIGIADLAYGRHAGHQHAASFTGRQLQESVVAFLGHQLGRGAGGAHHLRAFARTELDVVHRGAGRNVLERQRVADQDVCLRPTHDRLTNLETDGLNDVALLAVEVIHQRDARQRLGSYSIEATLPGTPNLSRLKSIRRSFCLWPPPWWRMVKSPELRRPPVRCLTASNGL